MKEYILHLPCIVTIIVEKELKTFFLRRKKFIKRELPYNAIFERRVLLESPPIEKMTFTLSFITYENKFKLDYITNSEDGKFIYILEKDEVFLNKYATTPLREDDIIGVQDLIKNMGQRLKEKDWKVIKFDKRFPSAHYPEGF